MSLYWLFFAINPKGFPPSADNISKTQSNTTVNVMTNEKIFEYYKTQGQISKSNDRFDRTMVAIQFIFVIAGVTMAGVIANIVAWTTQPFMFK